MRAVIIVFMATAVALTAAQGPADSAVDFAKKLGAGQVNLAPDADTAIISEVSPQKKESILQRLQRLAVELNGENIEVGPTRIEGSFAGVILRMVDTADPMSIRVLPLAMVRDGETWRAAPVPASFENTAAAYSRSARVITQRLELWLASEHTNEVERLRKSSLNILRKSLADTISPETIRTWTLAEAISAFLEACEKRDTKRILALIGGLSDPLPEGWQQLAASVSSASNSTAGSSTWSLLTSPAVLRMPLWDESIKGKEASFRVIFLDPRSEDAGAVLEQTLSIHADEDGLWKISIPESEPAVIGENEINGTLASHLARRYPVRVQTTAQNLKDSLLSSLRLPEFPNNWVDSMHREGDPVSDLGRFMRATVIRWEITNSAKPVIPIELGFQEESDHAYLAVQWLSLGKLTYAPRIFHLQKNPDGWVWNPSPSMDASAAAEKWVKKQESEWKKFHLERAIQSCSQIDPSLPAPGKSEANALVQDWLNALSSANWHKALSLCAQLGNDQSPTPLLRNLGYECKSVHLSAKSPPYELLGSGKSVTLVATRSIAAAGEFQSLLPVVSTANGPRILLEIDLGAPSRPGRAFLNRNALERLSSAHPKMAEELKEMLSRMEQEVGK